MKSFDVQAGMDELDTPVSDKVEIDLEMQEKLMKRQLELNKEFEKRKENVTNYEHIEKFLEEFSTKKVEIERKLETIDKTCTPVDFLNNINSEIQELQNLYSNSLIFLRIYDRKTCQAAIQNLHSNLKEVESKLLPKKKFGFKVKKTKTEHDNKNKTNGQDVVDKLTSELKLFEFCGFQNYKNEVLILRNNEIERKDVSLDNLSNCTIKLLGAPSTLHITNINSCKIFCGPVGTSIMIEKCKNSSLYLACQQLRIHETTNTKIHLHVTSKAIIEDSTNVMFGVYNFTYNDIEEHYKIANLDKTVNHWNDVDDFNWLAADKHSPNWSLLDDEELIEDNS